MKLILHWTVLKCYPWQNKKYYYLTNSMTQVPHIHMSSPTISILSRINPNPRTDIIFLFRVYPNTVLPSKPRPSQGSPFCRLRAQILKALLSPPHSIPAKCSVHFNHLDLITRHKLRSSSFWCLLHFPFPSLLVPNIRLRIQYLRYMTSGGNCWIAQKLW